MNLQVKGFQSNRIHFNTVRYEGKSAGTKNTGIGYGLYPVVSWGSYIDRQAPQLSS